MIRYVSVEAVELVTHLHTSCAVVCDRISLRVVEAFQLRINVGCEMRAWLSHSVGSPPLLNSVYCNTCASNL